jgi:hypothetical protein
MPKSRKGVRETLVASALAKKPIKSSVLYGARMKKIKKGAK